MQSDGQLSDLTDPLLLLRNSRPHKLLKLSVENGDGFCAATLRGKLPDASDGRAGLLAPELILLTEKQRERDSYITKYEHREPSSPPPWLAAACGSSPVFFGVR